MFTGIGAVLLGMGLLLGGCGEEPKETDTVKTAEDTAAEEADTEETDAQKAETQETAAQEQQETAAYDRENSSLPQWQEQLQAEKTQEIASAAVRGMQIVKDNETILAVSYEPRTYKNSYDCWALSIPYESWVSVDTEGMYECFSYLEQMDLKQVQVSQEEAGTGESRTSVFVAYFSGQEEGSAGQAQPDAGITYRIGNQDSSGRYYIETSAQDGIWTADPAAVEGLLAADPYDCILKVANVVSIETVSSVDMEIEGKTYTMDLSEHGSYKLSGKETEQQEVYNLYTSLMSIFVEKEIEGEQHDSDPMLRITFHRNTEEAPEIVETFYSCGTEYAAVNINGTEFFLADRAAVEELIGIIEKTF